MDKLQNLKTVLSKIVELFSGDYNTVRAQYHTGVYDAVYGYLTAERASVTYRNAFKAEIATAFTRAADMAWVDGGGQLPLDAEASAYIGMRQSLEFGYVDMLFAEMKNMRNEDGYSVARFAGDRADGYAKTLDQIYNDIKVRAAKNKMLTFGGDDGAESCKTCQTMKGKRHRASWWTSHGLVPGPGNMNYECRGFRCQHYLYDDAGRMFTL